MIIAEDASAGKAVRQSGTVLGRSAEYAVDGDTNTTDLGICASAVIVADDELLEAVAAWWQVDLGDFYLVNQITVYFPTTGQGQYRTNDTFRELCISPVYRRLAVAKLSKSTM